ncbi:membrane hypothetical protein [uncultured Gammaproteobacteria bacterium]
MASVGTALHHPLAFPGKGGRDGGPFSMTAAVAKLATIVHAMTILRRLILIVFATQVGLTIFGLVLRAWFPVGLEMVGLMHPVGRLDSLVLGFSGAILGLLLLYSGYKKTGDGHYQDIAEEWEILFGTGSPIAVKGDDLDQEIGRVFKAFSSVSDMALTGYQKTGWFYANVSLLLVIAEAVISRNL